MTRGPGPCAGGPVCTPTSARNPARCERSSTPPWSVTPARSPGGAAGNWLTIILVTLPLLVLIAVPLELPAVVLGILLEAGFIRVLTAQRGVPRGAGGS